MATIERYARGWAELNGVECHPGLELRDADDVEELTHWVQTLALGALIMGGGNHTLVVSYVEKAIRRAHHDRAFFIETEEAGRGVQVFQPYGLPRGR